MPRNDGPRRVMHEGRPSWRFPDGTVLPVISGGSEDDDDSDDALGEKGKKALAEERQKARDAEKARKAAEKAAADAAKERDALQAQIDELKAGDQTEHEKQLAAARKEAADEARKDEQAKREAERAEFLKDKKKVKLEAAAVGKLANPALAPNLVDLDSIDIDDDGKVDDTKVAEAISKLLKDEPYLKANGVKPDVGGGARPGGGTDSSRIDRARAAASRVAGAKVKAGAD